MHLALAACLVGGLLPPLAPPNPSQVLSSVAELILRARLRECESCDIAVSASPAALLGGSVDAVRVRGDRWCTPMRLSCRALDVQVGATAIDFAALTTKRRILLRRPATGTASIRFTAVDWDNFLCHPQMAEAVASRRGSAPTPTVAFLRNGGARLSVVDGGSGVVAFPVSFDGARLEARLSQRADGAVECFAQPQAGEAEDALGAAARAGPWLGALFADLVLDLDGCALSFKSLRVAQSGRSGEAELTLQLDVCVSRFPSLDINF